MRSGKVFEAESPGRFHNASVSDRGLAVYSPALLPDARQQARIIIYDAGGQPIIPSTGKPGPPA